MDCSTSVLSGHPSDRSQSFKSRSLRPSPQPFFSSAVFVGILLIMIAILVEVVGPEPDTSVCMEHCDTHRKKGTLGAFQLKCDKVYNTSVSIHQCRLDCDACPDSLCDSEVDYNVYNCPFVHFAETCRSHCAQYRKMFFGDRHVSAFYFLCSATENEDRCREQCSSCPKSVCDPSVDNGRFACPSLANPRFLSDPPESPEYEGRCKDRCVKHRLGGSHKYTFECTATYHAMNADDLAQCIDDCQFCPADICSESSGKFMCPAEFDWITIGFILAAVVAFLMAVLCVVSTLAFYLLRKRIRKTAAADKMKNVKFKGKDLGKSKEKDGGKSKDKDSQSTSLTTSTSSTKTSTSLLAASSSAPSSVPSLLTLQQEEGKWKDDSDAFMKRASVAFPEKRLSGGHETSARDTKSHHHKHHHHGKHH